MNDESGKQQGNVVKQLFADAKKLNTKQLSLLMKQLEEVNETPVTIGIEKKERKPRKWNHVATRVINMTRDIDGNAFSKNEQYVKIVKISISGTEGSEGIIQYAGVRWSSSGPAEVWTKKVEKKQKELLEERYLDSRCTMKIKKLPENWGSTKQLLDIERHWFIRPQVRMNNIRENLKILGIPTSNSNKIMKQINSTRSKKNIPLLTAEIKHTIFGIVLFRIRDQGMYKGSPQNIKFERREEIRKKKIRGQTKRNLRTKGKGQNI